MRLGDLPFAEKAALLASLALGLPLLGLTIGSGLFLRHRGIADAERLLVSQVEGITAQLDAVNDDHLREVHLLLALPSTRAYCDADEAGRAALQAGMRTALRALVDTGNQLAMAALFSPEGIVWVSTVEAAEGIDASARPFLASAAAGRETVSDVFRTLPVAGSQLLVAYVSPLHGNREIRCLAGVMASADQFTTIMNQSEQFAGDGGFSVLLDNGGVRVANSLRGDFSLRPAGDLPADEVAEMVAAARFGPETASLLASPVHNAKLFELARAAELPETLPPFWSFSAANEAENLSIARRLRSVPWTLVARIPKSSILAPVHTRVLQEIVLGLAVLSLAVVLAVAAMRGVVRRINAMAAAAKSLADGQLSARIHDDSGDELGRVARQFNRMAEALQHDRGSLEARVSERTQALHAANAELEAQKEELLAQRGELEAQQSELLAQTAQLEQRNNEVEAANRLKSEFLSNMSHELRTPLNAVIGFSDLLLNDESSPLPPRQRDFAAAIARAGRDQLALVGDILDLAKIEAGHLRLQLEELVVADALSLAQQSLAPQSLRKQITFRVDSTATRLVVADARRLHQILLNLASNAVKFSPEQGSVEAVAYDADGMIAFELLDRGPGIANELWSRLFRPFEQGESPMVKAHEGTGLGLAISRRLVELHGGEISASPRQGGGLVVRFTLPAAGSARSSRPAALSPTAAAVSGQYSASKQGMPMEQAGVLSPPATDAARGRVLVIDDDPAVARLLSEILPVRGIEVEAAGTADEGLARIASRPPDLCILDFRLSGTDGLQVLRRLRASAGGAGVRVLLFSGADLSEPELAAVHALGGSFVKKGEVSVRDVVAGIESALTSAARASISPVGRAMLVIDDNELNRSLLRSILESRGYSVLEAADAVTGLALARSELPAIILMDLAMPGQDGLATTRMLKADPVTVQIPVIAVTALAMRRDEEAALRAGADAYVTKPIDAEALIRRIEIILLGVAS